MANPYPNKVPAGFPDAGTFVTRQINEDWLGVVIGACERLKYRYWVDENDDPIADAAIFDQLILMLQTEVSVSMVREIGELVTMTAASSDPSLLELDGSTVNRADYPDLADKWGIPSGDSTFVLPDFTDKIPYGNSPANVLSAVGSNSRSANEVPLMSHTHLWGTTGNYVQEYGTHPSSAPAMPLLTGSNNGIAVPLPLQTSDHQSPNPSTLDMRQSGISVIYYVVAL